MYCKSKGQLICRYKKFLQNLAARNLPGLLSQKQDENWIHIAIRPLHREKLMEGVNEFLRASSVSPGSKVNIFTWTYFL